MTIPHSIRLELYFILLFLKVKSDHSWRFYGHFNDFSPVCRITRICQNDEIAIESSKMLGWSSNKFGWITNFTSFHAVFVFRSSIPIFSCQNSIFHVQLLDFRMSPQATGEKSLKWPWNLEKWSDFTFKKRKRRKKTSLIEWAIEILGWIRYLAVKNWHLC